MARLLDLIHSRASAEMDLSHRASMENILQRMIPEERFREEDLLLEMLLNGVWHERRVVLTKEKLSFAFEEDENEIDHIPLAEIEYVKGMKDLVNSSRHGHNDLETGTHNPIQIATREEGYNSGRTYYLRAESAEACYKFANALHDNAKAARKRAEVHSLYGQIQRKVRKVYQSNMFQGSVALLITANFVFTVIEAQELDKLQNPDGSNTPLADMLDTLNQAFTYVFAAELAINAFAHWFKPFFYDFWNILDIVVVAVSILSVVVASGSTGIIRIIRAIRVIRLFGRLKALKKIISALSMALLPVLNVFLILFLLLSIAAIVGVTLFHDVDPDDFSIFSLAFFTLFQVTAGDPWPEALPRVNEDGSLNWTVKLYTTLYTIVVVWVILQVSVAVLLDNFIGASTQMAMEERLRQSEQKQREQLMKNPLEPLLMKLAREFTDSEDLSDRLLKLYSALDKDRAGALNSQEFCAAMRKLDFKPCIHISDSDFDSITRNGELCNERGQLGPSEFEVVMRTQIRHMAQTRLSLITEVRSQEDADFMLHGSLKMIFMEQTRMEKTIDQTARDVRQILVALANPEKPSESSNNLLTRRAAIRAPSKGRKHLHAFDSGTDTAASPTSQQAARQMTSGSAAVASSSAGSFSLSAFAGRVERRFDEVTASVVEPLRRELSGLRALLSISSPHRRCDELKSSQSYSDTISWRIGDKGIEIEDLPRLRGDLVFLNGSSMSAASPSSVDTVPAQTPGKVRLHRLALRARQRTKGASQRRESVNLKVDSCNGLHSGAIENNLDVKFNTLSSGTTRERRRLSIDTAYKVPMKDASPHKDHHLQGNGPSSDHHELLISESTPTSTTGSSGLTKGDLHIQFLPPNIQVTCDQAQKGPTLAGQDPTLLQRDSSSSEICLDEIASAMCTAKNAADDLQVQSSRSASVPMLFDRNNEIAALEDLGNLDTPDPLWSNLPGHEGQTNKGP